LNRGQRLVEILKQPQYQPLEVEQQVLLIYAGTNGYLDSIPVDQVHAYEEELYRFVGARHAALFTGIAEKKELTDELKARVEAVLKEFGQQFHAGQKVA